MKHAPLLIQVIVINTIAFLVMGLFGYFLVLPAIEKPYVEETYTQINFQLSEMKDNVEFHPDRRYIYLRYTIADETVQYVNNFPNVEIVSRLAALFPTLPVDSVLQNNALTIEVVDADNITVLYSYVATDTYIYLVGMVGDLNPLLSDPLLLQRIISVAIIAFFLPVLAILIWSIFISGSIRSLSRRIKRPERRQRPLLLARELDMLYEGLLAYEKEITKNESDKQVLFQSISHELKTPIAAIQSYAEAIEDGLLNEQQIKESSKVIQDKTKTLLEMVNQIMQLNRISYLEQHPTDEHQAALINLSDVLFSLMDKYQSAHPNVHFNANLVPILFRGDISTWKTVLGNIFDNNIRHGATEISLTIAKDFLQIDNNGERIPDELVRQLFTPFKKGEKGSFGLGLTIIQRALNTFHYRVRIDNLAQGVRYTIEATELDLRS